MPVVKNARFVLRWPHFCSYYVLCSVDTQKCYYCRSRLQSSGKDQGACVQCCAGKCAVSYHVTCFVMAGFGLEASDWPQPTETYCDRHQKSRTKVSHLNLPIT